MILKETQVVCKKCNKVLTVANPKGLRSGHCTCGICHSRLEVNFWVEEKNIVTSFGGKDETATALPRSTMVTEHRAFLMVEGALHALEIGNNVVGRWSPSAQADVQLRVNDEYLSRQHVMVNVYRQPDGRLRLTVRNYKNKNETTVNDTPLEQDSVVVVADGDNIKMADTLARVVVTPLDRHNRQHSKGEKFRG